MVESIDYASSQPSVLRPKLLKAARALAAAPLCAGVLCTLGGVVLSATPVAGVFALAGFAVLIGGLVCVGASLVCLSMYVASARGSGLVEHRALNRQRTGVIALVAINFPAAVGCMLLGAWALMRVVVPIDVVNAGSTTVSECVINSSDGNHMIGVLAPGERQRVKISGNGVNVLVTCTVVQNGQKLSREIARWGDEDDSRAYSSGLTVTIRDGSIDRH